MVAVPMRLVNVWYSLQLRNKARMAKKVDPSLTSKANRYIKSYMASAPSKKLIFTKGLTSGASHRVGCWIGETVKIP